MLHKTRNLVADWRKGDASKLARLMMEAAVAWPGGGGWQTTPEEEERHIRESNLIGAFVTEDSRRIISLCTLRAKPGQKEHAFIPHLNCHPDFHGKKHGKSVLWTAVERACEAGYRKVDLYTWPGNLKAVPLYKKMGFMWQPDSAVHMENFTPAARRHPLGMAYFAKHDWYNTQVRTLTLEEDLVKRGEVRVYEYLWRDGDGTFLRMVFDRQSWGIIEVENNDLLASCSLPDEKLVAGIPHPVRWRIVNRRSAPVRVILSASGDPGIDVRKREMLKIKDAVELKGTFVIDPNIPEKTQDPRAAILRTDLLIDGVDVQLAAGIEAQQAIAISLDAPRSVIRPGVPQEVVLTLRSNLNRKATAHLSVLPAGGATVGKREHAISLDPRGGAEVRVPVTAGTGPVRLDVEGVAGKEKVRIKTRRVDLLTVERGGVSGGVGEDRALLCGGGLMASVDLRRGDVSAYHRLRAERASRLWLSSPRLGPPFSWEDFFQEKAEASVEEEPCGAAIRVRSRSLLRPGVVLDRRIALGQGPLIQVVDTILNGSAIPLDLSMSQGWNVSLGAGSEQVVPRKQGVYRNTGGAGGRDLGNLNLSEEGTQWPEGWVCTQREDGCAAGVLWDCAERVEPGRWGNEIRRKVGRLEPGQTRTLDPIYAFVGDGNWQTVRGWWQTLFGEGVPEIETIGARTRRPIEPGIDPNPLLIADGKVEAILSLHSVGEHKLNGKLQVELPAGLRSDACAIDVSGLCASRPVVRKLPLRATKSARPGSARIGVRFETDEAIYHSSARALILVRRAPEVHVSCEDEGRVMAIHNGILTAKVAPGFRGSVISLRREGKEFLNSSYPEAGIRGFMNPWHGGISPSYGRLWGGLHKEQFRHRVVERKGRQGLVWRGVRVGCTITQERARGQSIALDYLLARGADALAIVPSCRDELGILSDGHIGFAISPAFAASPRTASFCNPSAASITALAAPHWSEAGGWDWGGVVGEGMALFLSARGEGVRAGGRALGDVGCELEGHVERPIPARGSIEGLFFVLPAFGPEDAEAHAVWSEFEELP